MSDWERIGGEEGVERVVTAFVDRFFDDMIIGFLFTGKDRDRIARHELELASAHLGGGMPYTGRPVGPLHQRMRIHRGHFRRRLAIVRHVLREHGVPEDVVERWIDHDRRLERALTDPTDCVGGPDDS